jgi:hypothetical protein
MALKNYTSQVSAARSIEFIERKLVKHGARHILKEYTADGRVKGISFSIPLYNTDVPFRLPANVAACEKVLRDNLSPRATAETRKKVAAQAERTAWKILCDWVEVQMSMIELAQVDFMQVFMPYVFSESRGKTAYEIAAENNFQRLLPGEESNG